MTIQDLGSIGELLAAIATIATLIYLALQIRASAAATRAEARRAMDQSGYESVRQIAGDPDLAQLFLRGLAKPEELDPDQAFRFRLFMSYFFSAQDTAWKEVRLGTMTEQQLGENLARIRPFVDTRGGEMWWNENVHMFPPEFRDYFEAEIPRLKR